MSRSCARQVHLLSTDVVTTFQQCKTAKKDVSTLQADVELHLDAADRATSLAQMRDAWTKLRGDLGKLEELLLKP